MNFILTGIFQENYEGLTNCTFTISDVDGWISATTFNITSTVNLNEILENSNLSFLIT